jgi:hypothetical protein
MKEKLQSILDLNIDLDQFYCVDVTKTEIRFQGRANLQTMSIVKGMGIELAYDNKYGWLESSKDGINVVLTMTHA